MAADVVERLRGVPLFQDLDREQLAWFVAQSRLVELEPGEVIIHEGDPADVMFVLLEGEIHVRREKGIPDGRVLITRSGEVTGMLPFSRLTHFPVTARAAEHSLVLCFPAARFPELLRRIPQLEPRLVAVLSDRIRTTTQYDQQQEKLVSLGRLAAGLAHELNNPASAAGRAASGLREALADVQRWTERLARCTEEAAMQRLDELASTLDPAAADQLDPVARGDREEEIAAWLEERAVEDGWRLASTLADAGVGVPWLEGFGAAVPAGTLPLALGWLEARLRAEEILRTVEQASSRISLLVGAVKEYTFMDRAPLQQVDVHAGLDSTLRMLAHKLRGVTVTREYAAELPRIPAMGGALNQVWTNLIDNAADAVGEGGHIWLRTAREGDAMRVAICDNGPGVPPEIRERIFEPFFTTKGVGQGSGLGLDIVRRIVAQHHGSIHLDSAPGDTRFEVRLPLAGAEMVERDEQLVTNQGDRDGDDLHPS